MTQHAVVTPGPWDTAALRDLLKAAAAEMESLSRIGSRLQPLIERAVVAGAIGQSIEDAQAIDYLLQHLSALGGFLDGLARETPAHLMVNAAPALTGLDLADLARRLAGQSAFAKGAAEHPGDCELF